MSRAITNCPVAVVGGAGFLGSHLVRHLVNDRACRVHVIDNLVVGRREFLAGVPHVFHHHDITQSEEHLYNLFVHNEINYVFNYAAYPYIPVSFARPKLVSLVNYMGAINVINAAADIPWVKGILQVSSAELYGNGCRIHEDATAHFQLGDDEKKLDESDPVIPHSTYGASKAAVDYYCQAAYKERKVPVIALRQFNCIGERETHPYVVPEIISQLGWYQSKTIGGPPLVKLGNNSYRDFMYAGDAVRVATRLLERGEFGEVYNLGSEQGIKIYDLAVTIGKLMGFNSVQVQQEASRVRPWEIWHLQSDNTKINRVVGEWKPTSLEDALAKTITYFNLSSRRWVWQ